MLELADMVEADPLNAKGGGVESKKDKGNPIIVLGERGRGEELSASPSSGGLKKRRVAICWVISVQITLCQFASLYCHTTPAGW